MPNQNLQNSQTDKLVTKDIDLHGRRTRNAADALLNQDYVTLNQLTSALANIKAQTNVISVGGGGRVYSLFRDGILGIQSDCCQRSFILAALTPTTVRCDVKDAPTGADLIIEIFQSATLWATVTITDGTVTGMVAPPGGLSSGNYFRVDITQVGTTYPGGFLTVTVA